LEPRFAPKARHSFLFSKQQKRKETKEKPFRTHNYTPILYSSHLHGFFCFLPESSRNIPSMAFYQIFLCPAIPLVCQISFASANIINEPDIQTGGNADFQLMMSVFIVPFPDLFCNPVFMSFKSKITC